MREVSQKDSILAWLKVKPITPAQALANFGCFRLAARVRDLKDDGYQIRTEMIETANGKHVARYSLGQCPS